MAHKPGFEVVRAFARTVGNASSLPTAVIDVGANNGEWSAAALEHCVNSLRGSGAPKPKLLMVEPQMQFWRPLRELARRWDGQFLPAAAWVREEELTFYLSQNSEAASVSHFETRAGFLEPTTVRGVDMARALGEFLQDVQGPVLCKVDVEGAEYQLLPRLLVTGMLCRCSHLLLEWHLNKVPPAQRLAGLALRHSLEATLQSGCGRLPQMVLHDECCAYDSPEFALHPHWSNNDGHVPGLAQLLGRQRRENDSRAARPPARVSRLPPLTPDQRGLAAGWLRTAKRGVCRATDGPADCAKADEGAFSLPDAAFADWATLAHSCAEACRRCQRCRVVSFSIRWADCSWYNVCPRFRVAQLDQRVDGFKTAAIKDLK